MDLNLLRVLDTLLQESSVTAAAERLGTSPPAVSRSLSRLRRITGDQLLVRAGQALVPTPRALAIRDTLHTLLGQADQLLRPGGEFDPTTISETFTVQVSDLFLTSVADPLLETLQREAPGVNVIFLPETLEGTTALRRGDVDVELGVLSHLDPETRHQTLAETTLLGVARATNPLFDGPIGAARFAGAAHIGISRLGKRRGPIDDALTRLGLHRRVAVVVPSHTSAMLLARSTDLVALTAPVWSDTIVAELGLATFPIPLDLLPMTIGVAWHPRNDIDPAHRWFRTQLSRAFIQAQQTSPEEEQREPAHAQGVGVATRNG
ncbi:LysR family transcriptional regulator [Mycolicibacterium fluoranthenivorans]|uniref:DNA-binding transcriptional LysR family regulator n=1 Tax=Mycolicibacterium fluoranthenivorans TaxID=258505 RepID=A0A7X5U0M7_9MYCO|nr:LysR family transcriptional regulator [Mycolicibacterium fluoranthenivorans]MCV7357664.1 LysR family transcriptional regulator [Mycolicibacterium fluoranthenivorans]NIH96225.1 DNA-binding transcriptional LysR family regulator [Mycolicibacterium fluoranthenivorans]